MDVLMNAIETYGHESQRMMAIEEMAELTKELCKFERKADNVSAIAEEIADVEIMLAQLKIMHGITDSVHDWKSYKMERLAERLKGKKQ